MSKNPVRPGSHPDSDLLDDMLSKQRITILCLIFLTAVTQSAGFTIWLIADNKPLAIAYIAISIGLVAWAGGEYLTRRSIEKRRDAASSQTVSL